LNNLLIQQLITNLQQQRAEPAVDAQPSAKEIIE
jgi:hypothetical protein